MYLKAKKGYMYTCGDLNLEDKYLVSEPYVDATEIGEYGFML